MENIDIFEIETVRGITIGYFRYTLDGRDFESNMILKGTDTPQKTVEDKVSTKLDEDADWMKTVTIKEERQVAEETEALDG